MEERDGKRKRNNNRKEGFVMDALKRQQEYMSMAQLGVAAYIKATTPALDIIKQREVYRWFKSIGLKPSTLEMLESKGMVIGHRKGNAKNSPIYYSKLEIQSALQAINDQKY